MQPNSPAQWTRKVPNELPLPTGSHRASRFLAYLRRRRLSKRSMSTTSLLPLYTASVKNHPATPNISAARKNIQRHQAMLLPALPALGRPSARPVCDGSTPPEDCGGLP